MNKSVLIGDIGGTNARFATFGEDGSQDRLDLKCEDFASLSEAANHYFRQTGTCAEKAILAVAAPISGNSIVFTNNHFSFQAPDLKRETNLAKLKIINDFKAVAEAVGDMGPEFISQIGGGEALPERPKSIIGIGTGLGIAYLTWENGSYHSHETEAGHVTMCFETEREFAIAGQIKAVVNINPVSAEQVCSGTGLKHIYDAIRRVDGKTEKPDLEPAEIAAHAIAGTCETAGESLELLLAFYGRIAGNDALMHDARSGVFLTGGLTLKLEKSLLASRFMEEFQNKGLRSELVGKMPVYIVKHPDPGMLGLEKLASRELF